MSVVFEKISALFSDKKNGGIVGPALTSFSFKVVGAAFSLLFSVLLTRTLGVKLVGDYFLLFTFISIGAVIARGGLDNPVVKNIASFLSLGEMQKAIVYFRSAFRFTLFTGVTISVVCTVSVMLVGEYFDMSKYAYLPFFSLAVVGLALIFLCAEGFRAQKKIALYQIFSGGVLPLLLCVGMYFFVETNNLSQAIGNYVFCVGLVTLLVYICWQKYGLGVSCGPSIALSHMGKEGLPYMWVSSMGLITNWYTTILLGFLCTSEDVALLSVALRVAALLSFILSAINSIAMPTLAEAYASGDMDTFKQVAKRISAISLALSLPAGIVLALASPLLLDLFGPEFISARPYLYVLIFSQLMSVALGPVGPVLMMSGNEKIVARSMTLSAAFTFIVGLYCITQFGGFGAALVNAIALIFANLYCFIYIKKKLHFWTIGVC